MAYKLNEKLRNLKPYDPIMGNYQIRLDANESFINIGDEMCDKLANTIVNLPFNRYPDPYASKLVNAFADFYNIEKECVTAGNGSDELISIIAGCFLEKGDKVLTFTPDFSMYDFYSHLYELEVVSVEKNDELEIDVDAAISYINRHNIKAVMFSNPCNPTSVGLAREKALHLIKGVDALVILDEAYMDFWDESLIGIASNYDNLILLRTCSKAIGLASLRLGFAIANPKLTRALRAAKSPYNVNGVSQAMGEIILKDKEFLQQGIKTIIRSRDTLYKGLKSICDKSDKVTKLFQTKTNFIFIETDFADTIYQELLSMSIAIRKMDRYIRISCGNKEENEKVIEAFSKILK